jgi:hypothetical protein
LTEEKKQELIANVIEKVDEKEYLTAADAKEIFLSTFHEAIQSNSKNPNAIVTYSAKTLQKYRKSFRFLEKRIVDSIPPQEPEITPTEMIPQEPILEQSTTQQPEKKGSSRNKCFNPTCMVRTPESGCDWIKAKCCRFRSCGSDRCNQMLIDHEELHRMLIQRDRESLSPQRDLHSCPAFQI